MRSFKRLRATLLLSSTLTVLAGSIIAPSLPGIYAVFQNVPQADFLSRLVLTLPALSIALFAPVSGWVMDRLGRKRPLIFSLVLFVVAGTSGAYLDDLHWILVGRAFLGLAVAGVMTATTTMAGDYFEGSSRSKFMGNMSAVMAVGGGFFVLLGGVLADISWRYPFYVYGVAVFVIPLVMWDLPDRKPAAQVDSSPESDQPLPAYWRIGGIYGLIFLGMVLFYLIPVQIPFVLETLGDISKTLTGMAISVATVTAAIASGLYPRLLQRTSFLGVFLIAFLLLGLGLVSIYFLPSFFMILVAMLIMGFGAGLLMPNSNVWIISLAPPSRRARYVGGLNTAWYLGQFFSPIAFEPVQAQVGSNASFGVMGASALLLVCTLLVYQWRRFSIEGA